MAEESFECDIISLEKHQIMIMIRIMMMIVMITRRMQGARMPRLMHAERGSQVGRVARRLQRLLGWEEWEWEYGCCGRSGSARVRAE